ncbi:ankyrin [Biscogniauxia marginata]|nr:ankyrin [Biscogniauxia marginata]
MATLAPISGTRAIKFTGITELYVPASPTADICFVHGFTGHPELTWRSKKRRAPDIPSHHSIRRRIGDSFPLGLRTSGVESNQVATTKPTSAEHVFWPRDLVPDILPEARVLTFGYDTHIRPPFSGPPSKNRLKDHAGDFLAALEGCRHSDPTRPLIFIAHSLGGLLVKDTLRISKDYEKYRPERALVYNCTTSLVFFGTPHAGSDPLGTVPRVLTYLCRLLSFKVNDDIVRLLMPEAERLDLLKDDFQRMVQEKEWHIHTFQEELPLNILSCKVVDDSSSCIDDRRHEIKVHIRADHVEMCRFSGFDDPEFEKVKTSLRHIREHLLARRQADPQSSSCDQTRTVSPPTKVLPMTIAQRVLFLEKLSFDSIDARYLTLKTAQRKTCEWLPKCDQYRAWQNPIRRQEHHGFFWIKGKPGTGKSVMMKYLLQCAKRSKQNDIIISFFFNARGSVLERTTEGLYRSLLYQLLKGTLDLDIDLECLVPLQHHADDNPWPLEGLKEAFGTIVEQLGIRRLVCFIDALDECPEDQIRDMVSFFEDIGDKAVEADSDVRVCFSSRHYPHISIRTGLQIILENESDHSHDIHIYIESKLRMNQLRYREEIAEEIFQKSSNIFLWAVLVVDILNKEYDEGRNINVRKRLGQIPKGLHQLFHDILTRDTNDLDGLVLCLQWILFANRPLRPEELYFAMELKLSLDSSSYWDRNQIPLEQINRSNLHMSKGLIEVTKKQSHIQFIHESVRDYLLRENGLQAIIQHQTGRDINLTCFSHDILKDSCLLQLRKLLHPHLQIPDSLPMAFSGDSAELRRQVEAEFPFLEYAVHNVLSHADSAQGAGLDQEGFLSTFPRELWIKLDNLLQKHQVRRHTDEAQLLYLLAEHNLAKLIEIHPDCHGGCLLQSEGGRYLYPLAAAMALGHHEAIRSLAVKAVKEKSAHDRDGGEERTRRVMEELADLSWIRSDRDSTLFKRENIFSVLCRLKSFILLELFRDRITARDIEDPKGSLDTVPLPVLGFLLQNGANINAIDAAGYTALFRAVQADDIEKAGLLLKEGADPDVYNRSKVGYGRSNRPLSVSQSATATMLLLRHGAGKYHWNSDQLNIQKAPNGDTYDPISVLVEPSNTQDSSFYRTESAGHWLHQAARAVEHPRAIELARLIVKFNEALITFANSDRGTPLHTAARAGNLEAIRFFCTLGRAELNAVNYRSETALFIAVEMNHPSIVQVLLANGALPNISDFSGRQPLHRAVEISRAEVVNMLLEDPRVDITASCDEGRSVITYALSNPDDSILRKLLEREDLDPDEPDNGGTTPLMYACWYNRSKQVSLLLDLGRCNVNSRDKAGETPFSYVVKKSPITKEGMKTIRILLGSNKVDLCVKMDGLPPVDYLTKLRDYGHSLEINKEEINEVISMVSAHTADWIARRSQVGAEDVS